MAKPLEHKTFSPWNWGAVAGMVVGALVLPTIGGAIGLGAILTGFTSLVLGGVIGGFGSKFVQESRYDSHVQAERDARVAASQSVVMSPAPSPYVVTPEQSAALAAAQAAGRSGAPVGQFTAAASGQAVPDMAQAR